MWGFLGWSMKVSEKISHLFSLKIFSLIIYASNETKNNNTQTINFINL